MRRAFLFFSGEDASALKENVSSFLDELGEASKVIGNCVIDEDNETRAENVFQKYYEELTTNFFTPEFSKKLRDKFGEDYLENEIVIVFVGNLNSPYVLKYFSQGIDYFLPKNEGQRLSNFKFYPILYYYDRKDDYPQIFANLREIEQVLKSNNSLDRIFIISDTIANSLRLSRSDLLGTLSFFTSQLPLQEQSDLDTLFADLDRNTTVTTFLDENLNSKYTSFGINAFYMPFKEIREVHAQRLSEIALNNLFSLNDGEISSAYTFFISNLGYFKDFESLKGRIIKINNKLKKDYLIRESPVLYSNFEDEIESAERKVVEWQTALFSGSLNKIKMELKKTVLGYEKEKGVFVKSEFEEDFRKSLRNTSIKTARKMPKGIIALFFALKKYSEDLKNWANIPPQLKSDLNRLEKLRLEFHKSVKNRILPLPYFLKVSIIAVLVDYAWFFISKLFANNLKSILGIVVFSLLIEGYAFFKYYICRKSIENKYEEWTEEIVNTADIIVDNIPFEIVNLLVPKLVPYITSDMQKVESLIENIKSEIRKTTVVSEQPVNIFIKKLPINYDSYFKTFLDPSAISNDLLKHLESIRSVTYDDGILINLDSVSKEFQEWIKNKSFDDVENCLPPEKSLNKFLEIYNVDDISGLLSKANEDIKLLISLENYDKITLSEIYQKFPHEYRELICLPSGLDSGFYDSKALKESSVLKDQKISATVTKSSSRNSLYVFLLLAYFPIIQLKQIPAMAKEYWKLSNDKRTKLHCLFKDIDTLPKIYCRKEGGRK